MIVWREDVKSLEERLRAAEAQRSSLSEQVVASRSELAHTQRQLERALTEAASAKAELDAVHEKVCVESLLLTRLTAPQYRDCVQLQGELRGEVSGLKRAMLQTSSDYEETIHNLNHELRTTRARMAAEAASADITRERAPRPTALVDSSSAASTSHGHPQPRRSWLQYGQNQHGRHAAEYGPIVTTDSNGDKLIVTVRQWHGREAWQRGDKVSPASSR